MKSAKEGTASEYLLKESEGQPSRASTRLSLGSSQQKRAIQQKVTNQILADKEINIFAPRPSAKRRPQPSARRCRHSSEESGVCVLNDANGDSDRAAKLACISPSFE